MYFKNFALISKVDIATANIKEGTTYCSKGLFKNCGRLTSVVMPDTVTAMGNDVFAFTTMLSKVELSKNLKPIPTDCTHKNTTTKTTKTATYFAKGVKTTTCEDCGKTVKTTVIPMKKLNTPSVKVKASKKAIKVTLKRRFPMQMA